MGEYKEILFSEIISLTGGLIAGSMLAFFTKRLEAVPAMLVLLPGFLEMKGSVGGSLTARIGSSLHKGTLNTKHPSRNLLAKEAFVSLCLLACTSVVLGLVATCFAWILTGSVVPVMILIPLLAVLITSVFEIVMFVYLSLYVYSKGHDPDNIMGPYVTTISDVTSILSLVLASAVLL